MAIDSMARRGNAVLIVIDVQERLTVAMPRRDAVVAATGKLVLTAALIGVPVLVTRQYPKGLGDTDPALLSAIDVAQQAGVYAGVIDKVAFDCFGETAFVTALRDTGRTQLIIAGMETHVCIAQTVLSGLGRGFDVHVAADACCSRGDENHRLALDRMRNAGAVVTATESVMYELVGEAGSEEFRALLGIVKG